MTSQHPTGSSSIMETPASLQENISLRPYNTLAIDIKARYYTELTDEQQLPQLVAFADKQQLPLLILGGGSNSIFAEDFNGLVIKIALQGISIDEQPSRILVTAAAGQNWSQLVNHCLQRGYNGLENLSLIPGSVGAAAIQNIGAYGVELTDVFWQLKGWDRGQQCWRVFNVKECQFGYRDSVFKQALKDRIIIVSVTLALQKNTETNAAYHALAQELANQQCHHPSPQQVADAVIAIRQRKLPDPKVLPNAGSFFKNPIISKEHAGQLLVSHPTMVQYPQSDGRVKLAAGWLLEQCGWKGKRVGPVGMHHLQSLVMVNYDHGTGADVINLAAAIQADIQQHFCITLEIEPVLIGSTKLA